MSLYLIKVVLDDQLHTLDDFHLFITFLNVFFFARNFPNVLLPNQFHNTTLINESFSYA